MQYCTGMHAGSRLFQRALGKRGHSVDVAGAIDVGFSRVEARVGQLRRSSDRVERAGAFALGGSARLVERLTAGRLLPAWSGAKTYLAWR